MQEKLADPLKIFELRHFEQPIPEEFNAVEVSIDGQMQASLDWKQACEIACIYKSRGLKIFWQLNLGLFTQLKWPLSNQTQFQALFLSLEHFRDAVWKEFSQDSIGLCFCRSNADFSKGFPWDEDQIINWQGWLQERFKAIQTLKVEIESKEIRVDRFEDCMPQDIAFKSLAQLYCRDAAAEYIQYLAANLTDSIPLYAMLDASDVVDPLSLAMLTTNERFDPLSLMIKGGFITAREYAWQKGCYTRGFIGERLVPPLSEEVKTGICLPSMEKVSPSQYKGLKEVLELLIQRKVIFRLIPEISLINQWDGLDDLIVGSSTIDFQFRRKLQGFCAAGGRVVTLDGSLGLPHEITFDSMINFI